MKITGIIYSFHKNCVIVKQPVDVVKETEKCYFTAYGSRIMKSDIGKPVLKSPAEYTYVRLLMVDADEATLREELSKWFTNKAYEIWKMN